MGTSLRRPAERQAVIFRERTAWDEAEGVKSRMGKGTREGLEAEADTTPSPCRERSLIARNGAGGPPV